MPDLCNTQLPPGISKSCLKLPDGVKNIIITDDDVTFTQTSFTDYDVWETNIGTNLDTWLANQVVNYDPTTDDPTINTAGLGQKFLTRKPTPSGVFYLEANVCDFNLMVGSLKGGIYRVIFILEDGTMMATFRRTTTGLTIRGLQARITAQEIGIPVADAKENSFPLYVNFTSQVEFENRYFDRPDITDWDPRIDLITLLPVGVDVVVENPYVETTEEYKVAMVAPCRTRVADLTDSDISVVSSKLSGTAGAAVTSLTYSAALQNYILIFEDGGSVALVAADEVVWKVDETNTYASLDVKVIVESS